MDLEIIDGDNEGWIVTIAAATMHFHSVPIVTTGTLPNIRNTLNKKSTRHSGPRIAANSYE